MSILSASIVATSSMSAHPDMDIKKCIDVVTNNRKSLISVAFPYSKSHESGGITKSAFDKAVEMLEKMKLERNQKEEAEKSVSKNAAEAHYENIEDSDVNK